MTAHYAMTRDNTLTLRRPGAARVLQSAAGALANLALHEATRPQLIADGTVRPLVALCTNR